MKPRLVIATVLALVVGLGVSVAAHFFKISSAQYATSLNELELQSLQIQEAWLSSGAAPESVDLAIGVSENGLSKSLKSLQGVKATSYLVEGVILEIAETNVDISPGNIDLTLSIRVQQKGTSVSATFRAQGVLLVESIETDKQKFGASSANYRIAIREVNAELNLGLLSIRTFRLVNQVMAFHAAKEFSESLRFSLPIDIPVHPDFSVSSTKTEKTDHGEFKVHYNFTNPRLFSNTIVSIVPSIASSDALWFLSEARNSPEPTGIDSMSGGSNSMHEIEEMRSRVANLVSEFPTTNADVEIYANSSLFEKAIESLNGLSIEQRTISAELVSKEGYLVEDYKEADVVGRGGYSIQFRDDKSMTGWGQLPTLTVAWSEGSGLTLTGNMQVRAKARLRLHIDPYIGGGFHTNLGVNGSATLPFMVVLDARRISLDDGTTAAVIGPSIKCIQFPVKFESGGDLKIGIISYEHLGERQPNPEILMSSHILWTRLAKKGKSGILHFHDDHWMGFRIVPESVRSGTKGYRFLGRLESSLESGRRLETAEMESQKERIRQRWKSEVQTECPKDRPNEFLFAGHQFGPNNTIVKGLKVAGASLELSGKAVELPWNVMKTIITEPTNTFKVVGKELEDVGKKVEKVIKKIGDFLGF